MLIVTVFSNLIVLRLSCAFSFTYLPHQRLIPKREIFHETLALPAIRLSSSDEEIYNDAALARSFSPSSLALKATKIFELASKPSIYTSKESLASWEVEIDGLVKEIRYVKKSDILLNIYYAVLSKSAINILDPLQIATFELISNSVMDGLIGIYPKNIPITELTDEITDLHLDFIEQFKKVIESSGDDRYSITNLH